MEASKWPPTLVSGRYRRRPVYLGIVEAIAVTIALAIGLGVLGHLIGRWTSASTGATRAIQTRDCGR